jgi:hypothetical protein
MEDNDLDKLFGDDIQGGHDNKSNVIVQNNVIVPNNDSNKPQPELLTNDQKLLILKKWDANPNSPPSIEELCEIACPGQKLDGRSKIGREIKKYLSERDLKPLTKTEYTPKGLLKLTDEEKEFVKNNPNMKGAEIACALWNKSFFANNSQEVKTILAYQIELENNTGFKKSIEDDEPIETFRPPKTLDHACARINRHVDGANFDLKKLTPTQKKQCLMLISYMHSFRFCHHLNLIDNMDDRKLFENTFVKYIYNKSDLSQEDLDQYLALANEAVAESSIKRSITRLEKEQERNLEETGRLQMNIVDAIKVGRDEFNACRKRQDSLYKALEIERSKRLNERVGPQFTLLNIVEEMKNEERRKKIIAEAEKRNDKLKGEIQRLSELDEMIARIYGIDEDLVING